MNRLLLILLTTQFLVHSQSDIISLDKKFFLLGAINSPYSYVGPDMDYNNYQIDYFHELDNPTLDFIKKEINNDSLIDLKIMEEYLTSKYITKEIPKFIDGDSIYYSEFKEEKQIHSFLTGAFLRDGEKINDTIYKIHIPLSRKPSFCCELLKKAKCKQVFYRIIQNIPTQHMVYFNPSDDLKKYFAFIEKEPKRIEKIKMYYSKMFMEDAISEKRKKKKKEGLKFAKEFGSSFHDSVKKSHQEEIDTLKQMHLNRKNYLKKQYLPQE